jgi:hypothetical protein
MKRSIKLLAALSAAIMLLSLLPSMAFAESGTCGDNLTWSLTNDGMLTISGTGDMANYAKTQDVPWYAERSEIKSIVIENGITNIAKSAFYECESLEKIEVDPNNNNYMSVDGVLFDKAVTTLIQYPAGKSDKKYKIPNSVTTIGEDAFTACKNLTSVIIPEGVTSIENCAFYYCKSLKNFKVDSNNNNYTSVDGVLFDKYKTTLIQYPESKSNKKYKIPNGVMSIEKYAFGACYNLASVDVPSSVMSIGDKAFYYCTSLEKIEVDSNNNNYTSDDGVLFDKAMTTLIKYPKEKNDAAYEIPYGVTNVGNCAFLGCTALTSVTLPRSVTNIGKRAFGYCESLTDVYYRGSEYDWNDISIESDNDYLTYATIRYNTVTEQSDRELGKRTIADVVSAIYRMMMERFFNIVKSVLRGMANAG